MIVKSVKGKASALLRKIQRFVPVNKYDAEFKFRKEIVDQYVKWYKGEIGSLYGEPSPPDDKKAIIGTDEENAIITWLNLHQKPKYLDALQLGPDAFENCCLLDIGAAASPSALVFENCEVYCLDPLLPEFMKLGFPFWYYDFRAKFVYGYSEKMPFPDNFFDAIISVNALDHVDDFDKTADEISRILKPEGKLRVHLHYHKVTPTEPIELNDIIVGKAFHKIHNFRNICQTNEVKGSKLTNGETFNLWSNF